MILRILSANRTVHFPLIPFFLSALVVLSGSIGCTPSIPPATLNKSVPELIQDLKSDDGLIRSQAAIALGLKKEEAKEAIPALIKVLGDPKTHVRYRVMEALAQMGEPAVSALIAATEDNDRNIRFYAAHALKKIPAQRAQDAYKAYMDREGSKIIKYH